MSVPYPDTQPQPPYSEATVTTVREALNAASEQQEGDRTTAVCILDALAAAGLLLHEGAETRTEWGIRNDFGVHDYRNREQAEMWLDVSGSAAGELVCRAVHESPWLAVGDSKPTQDHGKEN